MRNEIAKVKKPKLNISPSVMPSGRLWPLPATDDERTMGNSGQIQGASIVTRPDKNAKPSRKIILSILQ